METLDYLTDYYRQYDEEGRLLSRHGAVEFLTTMRYIEKYLQPGARIIEIGAGTGRYSHALGQQGYHVDAVELLEHNIELFRRQMTANETISQGDATRLTAFDDETYDLTLLLGPMYHLFTQEDKLRALSEAIRVTRKGGTVFCAYCMGDASIMTYGFVRGHIHEIVEKCMLDTKTFETFSHPWDLFDLSRPDDINVLRRSFNVSQLHFVATDGYANHMREALAEMDEDDYQLFLSYHFATCERPDLIGFSHHTLDIFRKE